MSSTIDWYHWIVDNQDIAFSIKFLDQIYIYKFDLDHVQLYNISFEFYISLYKIQSEN